MFQFQGIWLPDGEKHFPEWMAKHGEIVGGRGTYQIKKLRAALEHCKQFRTAIDVGAHVGLWSMQLATPFDAVHAFEPVTIYRDCFERNLTWRLDAEEANVFLHECALGAAPGRVSMKIPALNGGLDTGGTHVVHGDDVEMQTLDSFGFRDIDFIKIDCEGYELQVLKGARETLDRWRPTIIVEQKQHKLGPNFGIKGTPAVDFLVAMGARVVREMGGDYILTWDA